MNNKKIIPYRKIKETINKLKGKKIVLVGGCFDLIHYGHVRFLEAAKKNGEILMIILESDDFIIYKKKRQPIHNQKQRAFILSHFAFVDYIILLPFFSKDSNYQNLVNEINPYLIAVSKKDPLYSKKKRYAKKINAKIKTVVPLFSPFSTSSILKSS